MHNKPNLFDIAPKELSQDAFFHWLISWANPMYKEVDWELRKTAINFIKYMLSKKIDFSKLEITKIKVYRQKQNVDIWIEINEEYAIIIEDKTSSSEHSNQLIRYKEKVNTYYKGRKFKIVYIYLKTGNESLTSLKEIEEKGYAIIDRKEILDILSDSQSTNDILADFVVHLSKIESETNSFNNFENIISNWQAAQGFYIKLQENLSEWSDWNYVSNPNGGFLGFWYHWKPFSKGSLYIQIENAFDYGIKLTIKITDWEPSIETLYNVLGGLQNIANENMIELQKPSRFKTGEYSTVAIVKDAFPEEQSQYVNFNFKKFLSILKKIENIIDLYCNKN